MRYAFLTTVFAICVSSAASAQEPEVCIYEHADFQGWKFCTSLEGFQDLSSRYSDQLSSLVVSPGYLVNYYDNADGGGGACVFYGEVGYVGDDCNDMASAISLEYDSAAEEQRQEEQRVADEAALRSGRVCFDSDDGSFSSGILEGISEGLSDSPCLESGYTLDYVGDDMNDDIETVLVFGEYTEVTLYEGANFEGRSVTLACGQYELIDDPENEVSSISTRVLDEPERCNMAIKQEVVDWQ
jgi:hypothetical protein